MCDRIKLLFIVSLWGLVLSASCAHEQKLDRQIASQSCDAIFADVPGLPYNKTLLNIDDARQLIAKNRPQEAAWLLMQIGEQARGLALENKIAKDLQQMPIESIRLLESAADTASEVYIVTFTNGQKAIFKPYAKYWKSKDTGNEAISNPKSEVMVYRLSRKLGINLVPTTVLRTIDGMEGSLQAFIDLNPEYDYTYAETQNPVLRRQIQELVDGPYEMQKLIIKALDYLTNNTDRGSIFDRNIGKWRLASKLSPRMQPGQGSGAVAYDNGAALQGANAKGRSPPSLPTLKNPKEILIYSNFFEALKNQLTEVEIQNMMKDDFSPEVINDTIRRRGFLLALYEKTLRKFNRSKGVQH